MKLYISPYRLVKFDALNPVGPIQIEEAKAKFLEKISGLREQSLLVNGQILQKNELFSLLDSLIDPAQSGFHEEIFSSPNLLHFLENGELSSHGTLTEKSFSEYSISFQQYVSPYFLGVYKERLKTAFQNSDALALKAIIQLQPMILTPEHQIEALNYLNDLLEILGQYGRNILQHLKAQKAESKPITNEIITLKMADVLKDLPFMHQEKLNKIAVVYQNIAQNYAFLNNKARANQFSNLAQTLKGETLTDFEMPEKQFIRDSDSFNPDRVLAEKIPPKSLDVGFLASVATALVFFTIFTVTYLKNRPELPKVIPSLMEIPMISPPVPVMTAAEKQIIIDQLKIDGLTLDKLFVVIERQFQEIEKTKNAWNNGEKIDILLKNWEKAYVLSENDQFAKARLSLMLRIVDKKSKTTSKFLQDFKRIGLMSDDEIEYLKTFKTKTFEAHFFYQSAFESLNSMAIYNLNHHCTEMMDNTLSEFEQKYQGLHTQEFRELKQKIKEDKLKHKK
jgi:hypothetical protein